MNENGIVQNTIVVSDKVSVWDGETAWCKNVIDLCTALTLFKNEAKTLNLILHTDCIDLSEVYATKYNI